MTTNEAKIEALLFAYGEPISIKELGRIIGIKSEDILESIATLEEKLSLENSGISLLLHDNKVQMVTKSQLKPTLEKLLRVELMEELTSASKETLAIIAYLGPISRGKIDYIRGVNSSYIIRNLSLRGLIEKTSDENHPNAYLYSLSFDFLKYLGIGKIKELPEYAKYHDLVSKLGG